VKNKSKKSTNPPANTRETELPISSRIFFENDNVVGKNGFKWQSKCNLIPSTSKISSKNIVHITPGPLGNALFSNEPVECFLLFFSSDLFTKIISHTNEEIVLQKQKYAQNVQNKSTFQNINLNEFKGLLGILIASAAMKNNHLNAVNLFDLSLCGYRYRSTMSLARFNFIINCLRFDLKNTRDERKTITKFAPISETWDILMKNCQKWYKPGLYLTIDEQLVGFRGRCPFKTYIPSKPNKYGIKIIMMCDNSTKYMISAIPYCGKGTVPSNVSASNYFVEQFVSSVKGSNRNITTDNWFTNIPLTQKLLKDYKLTVIGTIKKNKREFPVEFTDLKYSNRAVNTSLFLFSNNLTAVSYKTKPTKLVTLVSSLHSDDSINETTKKPTIVMHYNETKGGVDSFDQMCHNMNAGRKTKRWPLCIFYNMINIASINAYVIYVHNFYKNRKDTTKPLSRFQFMIRLQEQLVEDCMRSRLSNSKLPHNLKKNIEDCLGIKKRNTNTRSTD